MNTASILVIVACILVMRLGLAALIMLAFWPKQKDADLGSAPISHHEKV